MATVRVTRTTPVPPPPPIAKVDLSLSFEEAQFLSAVLSRIGGSPSNTIRKHAESIRSALEKEDIDFYFCKERDLGKAGSPYDSEPGHMSMKSDTRLEHRSVKYPNAKRHR